MEHCFSCGADDVCQFSRIQATLDKNLTESIR
jgi:hypothetical protein